jgi:Uma2 family endonuclease
MLILEPAVSERLIAERKRLGIDRYDEIWDGVYVMPPLANLEHQRVVTRLVRVCGAVVPRRGGQVFGGANVSDRNEDWEYNCRVPDIVVALTGCPAIDRGTHFQGGPDFLVEVRSPGDRSVEKLDFYAALGVREVLIVHRDTRATTLHRLARKRLAPVKPTPLDGEPFLVSKVLPLAFRAVDRRAGPRLEVRRTDGRARKWLV